MLTKTGASSEPLVVDKTVRVLIVDDSAVVRRLLEELLRGVPGVEVIGTAPNGEIALQRTDRLKPDVVTLDIEMPVMDGMQTLRALRDRGSTIRVVMFSTLTARGGHATLEALSLGADDYVTKPSRMSAADESLGELRRELTAKILQFFIKRPAAANGQPGRAPRLTISARRRKWTSSPSESLPAVPPRSPTSSRPCPRTFLVRLSLRSTCRRCSPRCWRSGWLPRADFESKKRARGAGWSLAWPSSRLEGVT